ncbi:MAG TPA: nucleoside hydrolase, partial [Bacteroidota bacterium]
SIDLFEHVKEKSRSLYDMAAAAIVKNPGWADSVVIHAPRFRNGRWVDHPENPRTVVIWENFDSEKIMRDFYRTMDQR